MPYPPEHKARTRRRIVRAARALFNRHGFNDVSIDQIMARAGLTRGGFYAHFKNKEELYAEAITLILEENPSKDWECVEIDLNAAHTIINAYLSQQHFDDIEGTCPLVALPGDVARGKAAAKRAYTKVMSAMITVLGANLPKDHPRPVETAQAITALCVGGMVLARAMGEEGSGRDIREAARRLALETGGWAEVSAAAE